MKEAAKNAPGLPATCYTVNYDAPREVRQLCAGESGFYLRSIETTNQQALQVAADLNAALSVTVFQEEAMVAGAMFGWHVLGADPAYLEKSAGQRLAKKQMRAAGE
jgi:hypothetical protein